MGMKLSICGKGGSGKSTLTGLLARQTADRDFKVLVVDSDESNSGLYRSLGFDGPPSSLMDFVGGKKTLKGKMGEKNILQHDRISIAGDDHKRLWAVLNKMSNEQTKRELTRTLASDRITIIGAVPHDPAVFEAGFRGMPIGACDAGRAAGKILERCLVGW